MKKILLIIPLLIFSTTLLFPQSKVNINNLSDYGGKMFNENDDKPYTGLVFDLYRTTGNKSLEGRYKDGLRNGKWIWWNVDNKMDSSGTYKDGNLNGKWTNWYVNGQKKAEGTYKDGQLDGKVKGYYENGQKRSEATLKDGEPDGLATGWYENGQKEREETYKDGVSNGKHTYWHENGQKRSEIIYNDGELNGKWTEWFENGQKKSEETYKDGVSNGKHTYWHENGKKKAEITYKDGMLIHTDLALLLDKEIQCNDDSIMVTRISIEIENNLIPFDEPYPTLFWWKVVQNLFDAGASHIIFNSNIPNISESYLDIERKYNNVYRNMNNDELNQFKWWVQKQDHFHRRLFCLGIDINSNIMPKFQLAQIIDTEDVTLSDPMEDLDWMSQFLPSEIPEWITAIEDETDRKEIMAFMGVGDYFDITQSPFYNNIILIGF